MTLQRSIKKITKTKKIDKSIHSITQKKRRIQIKETDRNKTKRRLTQCLPLDLFERNRTWQIEIVNLLFSLLLLLRRQESGEADAIRWGRWRRSHFSLSESKILRKKARVEATGNPSSSSRYGAGK